MQKQVKFEQAVKTKYPEQVVIAIAKDKSGRPNPVTLGWTMFASYDPPMLIIGVYKGHYTVKCIRHSKCFTLVYPSSDMAREALFYGSHSGRNMDKFKEFNRLVKSQKSRVYHGVVPVRRSRAKKIDSILLTDAVANFECRLVKQFATGDHIIFVGEVVCAHINKKTKKRLYSLGKGHKLGAV
jgi:flavin reductase (DIM6/NTAB) family NADH-FMN oxidoreductase RutF